MRKWGAEFLGTCVLIFVGCGAVAIGSYATPIGALPVAVAFGLTLMALIYALGPVSGCHINPAVTIALWVANRLRSADVAVYLIAQFSGAIVGSGLLWVVLAGRPEGYDVRTLGLGQNGWGPGYLGGYSTTSAFLTELLATAIFLCVILGATARDAVASHAGVAIGACLVVLIVTFMNVTGVSLNPARSLGPAVFTTEHALSQLWLFFAAPLLAAVVVGLLYRQS